MEVLHKENIGEVHFQHRIWSNQLSFYREELKIFEGRLGEISSKNTGSEVRIAIEQFQNRFIIQRNEIDTLQHLIHINEDEAVKSGKIHVRRIDYEATDQYINIQKSMTTFEKMYLELKNDFYQFLCKWM